MKRASRVLTIAVLSFIMLIAMASFAFADSIELKPTNNTSMFKVVTATLETESGQESLVISMSGSGYHELFKGTYEQALANGTATENWVHGYQNENSKWTFKIPLSSGETFIPIISISDSYYKGYVAGNNPIERAFFARQATINRDKKTIVTDDYNEVTDFAVVSNVVDFKVSDKASTAVVGGPNNNNYSVTPTLVMQDSTYDKVTYPTVVGSDISTASAELKDGKFVIDLENAPSKEAFRDKEPIEMTFHVASDAAYKEAGTDVIRKVTIDKLAKTITVEGTALTANEDPVAKADYTAVDAAIASIPADLSIYTDETAAAVNTAKDAVVRDKLATEQAEVDAMAKAIDDAVKALVEKPADYSAVDAAIAAIPEDLSIYTDETAAAVNTAKDAVVRGKTITAQTEVDAMAKAITDAVNGLVKKDVDPDDPPAKADYTAVDAAIASIPADLSIYTEESAAAVNAAKDAVVRGKMATEQPEVDAMAKAIEDAVNALVEKKEPEIVKEKTTISIVKKSNIKTIKAGGKKLKKNVTFTVKTKATSGAKTTYKKVTKGKISVSKAGKVTLKKGLKKGKYNIKVKVSCAETATANSASKTITLKITVK